jgi:hypothetical protein
MTMARRTPATPPGPEATIAAERAYAAVLARLDQLRAEQPPGQFGERLLAGLARPKRTGAGIHDAAERARLKAARHVENRADHHRGQEERRAATPPTRKQCQLLWCLGYRGPIPKTQAEVSAIVAKLTGRGT